MKKFLTVLLALSVVFTYSFSAVGTAFADANVEGALDAAHQAIYDEAVGPNNSILNARFETAWEANTTHDVYEDRQTSNVNYTITKKAYAGLKDDALKAVTEYIYAAAATAANAAELTQEFDTNQKIMDIVDAELKKELAQAQFAIDYANEVAKLDTVDVTAYSTEDYDPNVDDPDYTHREKAEAVIAKAKEDAAAIAKTIGVESTLTTCVLAWIDVSKLISNSVKVAGANPVIEEIEIDGIKTGVYELTDDTIKKNATDADKAEDAANKAELKAIVSKNVATYQKAQNAANKPADETLIAAYTEAYNVLIDANKVTTANQIELVSKFDPSDTVNGTDIYLIDDYKQVQELVAFGEKYKAEKDADGNLVRDAAAIDKIVKDNTIAAYNRGHATPWTGLQAAKDAIEGTTVESTAEGLDYAKKTAKEVVAKWVEDNSYNYYPAELAKINALVEEFNAKVDAATKTAEITKTTSGLYKTYMDKIGDVDDMDEVNAALKTKTAYQTAKGAVISYLDYYNQSLSATDKATKTIDKSDAVVEDALDEFYGEKGARTEAELKALKDEVLSIVDKLPTAGAQDAAKKAAQDAIDALPATITLADEAKVQAAVDAAKAYYDLGGNELATTYTDALDDARSDLYNAYRLDLNKKVTAVDKNDKAALNALADEFEATEDKRGDWQDGYCLKSATDLTTIGAYDTIDKALTDIRNAEKAAVKKAINAIPVNVTEADKATVEAARALYDAYVKEYTDYEDETFAGNAANDFLDCYRELALAEAALGLNEDPGKDVEALKITASSSAKKGSITVKWKVDGDTSAVTYFEVRKSTKKNSGFGNKPYFKTKNGDARQYKNTKGLKKGTRYYYKVRAVAEIDGVVYTSDWSNKAYRVAK